MRSCVCCKSIWNCQRDPQRELFVSERATSYRRGLEVQNQGWQYFGVRWLDTAFFGGGLTPPLASVNSLCLCRLLQSAVKPAHSKRLSLSSRIFASSCVQDTKIWDNHLGTGRLL